jgi:OmpR family response regulator RpaB
MPRLLLVEADPVLQRTLQKIFAAEEYFCAVTTGFADTLAALEGETFDLVVLDVGQVRAEGLRLLRELRSRHHLPVLLLAPHRNVVDAVNALEDGADAYLCEPFDPREVMALVQAHLRRAGPYSQPAGAHHRIDLGGVVLDTRRRDAFRDEVPLHLTTREFELLELFVRHRGEALASPRIFESIWGYTAELGMKALTVYVGRIRRKIEVDARQPRILLSIRGYGYKLAGDTPPGAEDPGCG